MTELIFQNWKPRCSSFGDLLTNLPQPFSEDDARKLKALQEEQRTGINENGNKTKWTDTKQAEVDKLVKKQNAKDELPQGAITKLEQIFNHLFWGRRKILISKYLDKGIIVEEDSLELLSEIENHQFWKNDQFIENDYLQGTYDTMDDRGSTKVIDAKSNFELETHQKATLTDLYEWQLKGYCWILGIRDGELVHCLVNTPSHIIKREEKSLWYSMGMPEDDEERWVAAVSQLERNHIFDIHKFRIDNPHHDLTNTVWKDIPAHMRIKRFPVRLENSDVEHMTRRSKMCKEWLIEREKKELELINKQ